MKMNLSIVMGMVDKVSAKAKSMSKETNRYTKAIQKSQKAQADDSAAMGMINSYNNIKKIKQQNKLTLQAEQEQLEKLTKKSKALQAPSAKLTAQIAKQQAKVSKLTTEQTGYQQNLSELRKNLTKTGVKVYKLDSEYERLSQSYKKHGKEITAVEKKYAKWQKRLSGVQKLGGAIKMPQIGKAALGKGAALLGGFSLAGLVSEVNSAAGEMDALAKKSATLKMSISELQAIRKQASHTGVEEDTMSSAMTRFTKRLGVLQTTGSGALGSYLKKSGNSAFKDLEGAANTQEAYETLLQSFSKLKTAQEQMAFADAAFGQDGRQMLLLLREGTEGLAKSRKELAELGGGASAEDAAKAEAYNDAMQRIQESYKSIKFAALAPIMEKVTNAFDKFTEKFKNAKFRDETIEQITQAVKGLYNGLEFLGRILVFTAKYFKEMIAVLAIVKAAMIAVNAIILGNPIGLLIAGIMAAVAAILYLVDHFWGLDNVMKAIGNGIRYLWGEFKKLINKLPDSLIPDGWKIDTEDAEKSVDNLASKMNKIKDKKAKLGVTTEQTDRKRTEVTTHSYLTGDFSQPEVANSDHLLNQSFDSLAKKMDKIKNKNAKLGITTEPNDRKRTEHTTPSYQAGELPLQSYQPLKPQSINNKSEVSLTIKSQTPVAIDKAKSDKGIDLNLDVGNMATSF
ncbi:MULTISPECIES: hypothetical protein [unclassified Vibrio]|uniref:hypothetical protein n=1 Tax=unclassified Vibrio TaxID=2614977 RepID=UPI00354CAB29